MSGCYAAQLCLSLTILIGFICTSRIRQPLLPPGRTCVPKCSLPYLYYSGAGHASLSRITVILVLVYKVALWSHINIPFFTKLLMYSFIYSHLLWFLFPHFIHQVLTHHSCYYYSRVQTAPDLASGCSHSGPLCISLLFETSPIFFFFLSSCFLTHYLPDAQPFISS